MSCYGCGTSFSTFKKEHGCKNCGFAFCTKCLPNKYEIAKMNNEKHRVCNKCYNILTGKVKPKSDPARYSPPENYKKRMAALQEREAAGLSGGVRPLGPNTGVRPHNKAKYTGMSQADIDLQQRLDKLKEKSPKEAAALAAAANTTNQQIDDRLANLKGMDPSRYNKTKPTYQAPDRRTQQEQMNDLLDEIGNEVELDSRLPDPTQEIATRLAQLRQKEGQNTQNNAANDTSGNNLNKTSQRDSQGFSQNIGDQSTSPSTSDNNTNQSRTTPNQASSNPDDQMSAEDVSRILNEASQELEIDAQKALSGLQEDKEIMRKLQQVKQRRKESSGDVNKDDDIEKSDSENEETDDYMADQIIQQAMEESKLDEAAAKDGLNITADGSKVNKKVNTGGSGGNRAMDDDEWDDPDELPYCCICTEDAVLRCFGCDRDLYCHKCFSDGHKELGLTDHASIKYTAPKGKS